MPGSAAPDEPRRLSEDLVLRRAGEADLEALVALNVELFGPQEEPGVTAHSAPSSGTEWLVVATGPDADQPGSDLASACARIPRRFAVDGHEVAGSQIEWVTTAPPHRGQGLVRALFAAHHQRAAAAGEVLQVVLGIPYYYRKLGYGYGFDHPRSFTIWPAAAVPDGELSVRAAEPDDVGWIVGLEPARARHGLTVVRDRETVARWVARSAAPGPAWEWLFVAEAAGQRRGWVQAYAWAGEAQLFVVPGHVPDGAVADALLDRAARVSSELAGRLGRPVEVLASDRPGSAWSGAVHRRGRPRPEPSGCYARVVDPVAALRALQPVLNRRIEASELATDTGEVVISLYDRAVRVAWAAGSVTTIEPAPADPDPFDAGGVGVAPDWFPALVLGRWGATGLAERTDDTLLGDHAAALDVLFPPRPADVAADL